jgi:hypothetical protein
MRVLEIRIRKRLDLGEDRGGESGLGEDIQHQWAIPFPEGETTVTILHVFLTAFSPLSHFIACFF